MYEPNAVVVPHSEVARAPLLYINIKETPDDHDNFADRFLKINAQGLQGGRRGKLDGCTIIGTRGRLN